MKHVLRIVAVALALAVTCAPGSAASPDQPPVFGTEVTLVMLPVFVADKQ